MILDILIASVSLLLVLCGYSCAWFLIHSFNVSGQVRSMGTVNPVTRQPVKGRKAGGGIRFGEMERDSLLAHGAAFLLHDRLHSCSDYHIANVCALCGSLLSILPVQLTRGALSSMMNLSFQQTGKKICGVCNTSKGIESVAMPFVFRYLAAELAAMNIKLAISLSNS